MSEQLLDSTSAHRRLVGAVNGSRRNRRLPRQPLDVDSAAVLKVRSSWLAASRSGYGPITIAIRARFEYDSTTIRLQHATTRYEVFRALAYEIVYENQW